MNNYDDVTREELDRFTATHRGPLECKESKTEYGVCVYWENTKTGNVVARFFRGDVSGPWHEHGWRIYQ